MVNAGFGRLFNLIRRPDINFLKLKSIYLLFFAGVLLSCSDVMHDITLEETFVAQVSHTYKIKNEILFRIDRVEDSRCPLRAQCVWQGEAKVFLSIDQPVSIDTVFSTTENKFSIQNYSFELIDVSPYPEVPDGIKMKDYRITMIVKK